MKFGIVVPTCREGFYVPTPFGKPEQFVQAARLAEQLGFFSVWANDHLNPTEDARTRFGRPPNLYESLTTLSWMAGATERVRLCTAALVVPLREVVLLAKQVSTLDVLSDGRVMLGVGVGVYRDEFAAVRPRERDVNRGIMLEEAMEALTALFTHNEVTFRGRYYNFEEVALNPKPAQSPLPIYLSGKMPDVLHRVARWGNGWLLSGASELGIRERIEALQPLLEERGRKVSEIDMATTLGLGIAATSREAIARFQRGLSGNPDKEQKRHYIKTHNLVGTASDIASQIELLGKEGITHCILQEFQVDTFDEMLEQVQMFGEEVLPLVKDM